MAPPSGPRVSICEFCGTSFTSTEKLRDHRRVHVKQNESHECTKCQKVFPEKSKLYQHVKDVHRNVKCECCDKTFFKKSNLTAHLKLIEKTPVAKPQNEFQQCNMRNKMLKNLASHKYQVHKNQSKCKYCYKVFTHKHNMERHMEQIHPLNIVRNILEEIIEETM